MALKLLKQLEAMQGCVADIRKWILIDRLKLNDDQTEFIMIGTRQQLSKVNIDSLCLMGTTVFIFHYSKKSWILAG